jgi:hypothetical protein
MERLRQEPTLARPKQEDHDPHLAIDLMDRELPKSMKSRTDMAEPPRTYDLKLMPLPEFMKSNTLKALDTRQKLLMLKLELHCT